MALKDAVLGICPVTIPEKVILISSWHIWEPNVLMIRAFYFVALAFVCCFVMPLRAQIAPAAFTEASFQNLSDQELTTLGRSALNVDAAQWKHAESGNFIYHYRHSTVASPAAVAAEFSWRLVSKELQREPVEKPGKCHVFLFESDLEWEQFSRSQPTDPFSGSIYLEGALFVHEVEGPGKEAGIAHDIAHVVVRRFLGTRVPAWLEEGYAEYVATGCSVAFRRARGATARPHSCSVPDGRFIPLAELASMAGCPKGEAEAGAFCAESERLVRFLNHVDKQRFLLFLGAMSKGSTFDWALKTAYGARYGSAAGLERAFRPYATQEMALPFAN